MYCVKCGVKLADTEKSCPLCGTVLYHPDLVQSEADSLYPKNKYPKTKKVSKLGIMAVVSIIALIPMLITFICDLHLSGGVTWSYYVMGAIAVAYITFVMPFWFKKPNPVIFTALFFITSGVYVLFINLFTKGDWYLSFAFPTISVFALIITALAALLYYLKRGTLYIVGGAFILVGGYMPLMELFISITFGTKYIWWSLYPMIPLMLIGLLLIFFGATPSARETVERKFFL